LAFRLAVSLAEGPQSAVFKLAKALPGHAHVPAVVKTSADEK